MTIAQDSHQDSRVPALTGGGVASLLGDAQNAVRSYFGYDSLRPHQEDVLSHVLAGKDCLAILPTGSGKTLCYAIPALVRPGLVLVVSPLIALIRDQARKFAAHGIRCSFLDSHQTSTEKEEALSDLMSGESRILLVSPERLARDRFRERLRSLPLQLVAIDEAHCISQWGAHFRPDYRHLGSYLADLQPVQKLAVTATATVRVRSDISQTLRLRDPALVWADFARSNLHLRILRADKVAEQMTLLLNTTMNSIGRGPGIIYAPTRKSVGEIHRMLVQAGIRAGMYHAGMRHDERHRQQRDFMEGRYQVVVATNAFGLGIDKGDIRFVHHAGLPASLEQYVQEIGRAGRDGKPAACALIYGSRDVHIQKFMINKSYPDPMLLKRALRATRAFVGTQMGQSEGELIYHLGQELKASRDDIVTSVGILCREGLLTRLKAQGESTYHDWCDVLIADGSHHDEEFFRDYPLRKMDDIDKLEAMRAYAATIGDPLHFLDAYFRKAR